ncbi:MAG: hypothetical protein GXY52_01315 [Chloroflexi bacterium]|nr:hypothetical protein [Chloroflexota bacterium]
MTKIAADLRQALRTNPDDSYDLIIRVEGDLAERTADLRAAGIDVKRQFKLTNSLQIRCSGAEALRLTRAGWLVRVDSNKPVRAFGR